MQRGGGSKERTNRSSAFDCRATLLPAGMDRTKFSLYSGSDRP